VVEANLTTGTTGPGAPAPPPPRRIRKIGHLALAVPDVPRAADFYTRVVHMEAVAEEDGAVYLRTQWEHHCLELHPADVPGVRHQGWETGSDAETEALRAHLASLGVPVRDAPPEPGRMGLAFQFRDAGGMWNEVYRTMERLPVMVGEGGFPRLRQGHFTRMSADVDAELALFRAAGFRVSDRIPGTQAFLRCAGEFGREHHAIGILGLGRGGLHHHAYDVGGWQGILGVLDGVARAGWPVEVGPVRHAPANNITVYVRDPYAVRVEFFCDMEQIWDDDDHDARRQPPVFDLWRRTPPPAGFRD
jgi:catechol 2,3-dioxygenase-like lactoylglutathione lyase family enzyme